MTPEAKVKAKVKKVLNELGAYYTMPMGTGFSSSGAPDFIICIAGLFYGIECKAQGNKPTALQLKHLDDIKKAGGVALVVNESNVNQLKELLGYDKDIKDFDVDRSRSERQRNSEEGENKRGIRVLRAP